MVHSQDTSHHHHADNAIHLSEDDGAVQHMHADSGAGSAALLPSMNPELAVQSTSPPETISTRWLSPTLEGLLRPPMPRAS